MDAANFLEGTGVDSPNLIVLEVPLCLESSREANIYVSTMVLHIPVIAITGNHAGFVILVLCPQSFSHLRCIVKDSEIVVELR